MVADRAKAMFELGDGADLQPRINTSSLPHHLPHNLPATQHTEPRITRASTAILLCSFIHTMYRGSFAPPPAQSPPLHHPVPQHVSTVPMMRSPPPPSQQTPNAGYGGGGGGNPYQPSPAQGSAPGFGGPGFGQFMNDPTAQMGFQVGKTAMMAGQEYMEQNVGSISTVSSLGVSISPRNHSSIAMCPYPP